MGRRGRNSNRDAAFYKGASPRPGTGTAIYRVLILLVAVVLLATAPVATSFVIRSRQDAENSPHWPHVAGSIRRSFIEEKSYRNSNPSIQFRPIVEFDYEVSGKRFVGNRISAAGLHLPEEGFEYLTRNYAKLKTDRYAAGTQHSVYYDPSDPARSVLEVGIGAGHDASFWFIGGLFALGLFLLYLLFGTAVLR